MHPLLTAAVVRGYVTAEQAREHADAQSAAELITRGLLTPEIARELEDAMNTLRRAGEDLRAAFDEGAGGVPPRIGRYTIVGELGRGGMGVVYRAEDTELRRTVAIKAIRDNAEPEERARFLREARAAAALRHPGIVPVHDVGEEGGRPYFIMEFVDGMSLLQAIERKTLTLRERVDAVRQAAVAVAAAHQRGILHRDLKPANILVTPEKQALVTDFGLARVEREPDRALSVSGVALGTPAYMSPEQARGRWSEVDARTDVYGLGATLYHALTGGPPFSAASIAEILAHVLEREPMAPRLLEPTVDRDLEAVCLKALEKDPARRYLSAQEFADDLDRWLAGKPLGGVPRPPRRWWIAFPAAALVAAAAAVALYPRRTATVPQQAESAGTTKSPSVEESAAKAVPPEVAATASARSLLRLAVHGV
jgi:eukaryotic-like serine/threonine-protein kinase